jgi:heme/copper-type cytochrome/quinol oxidase subunit 3
VNSASFDTRSRDAYWQATQSELKSIRKRGDFLILAGTTVLLALLAFYHEKSNDLAAWLVAGGLLLAVIVFALWFVATRKRRIAITRGLVCLRCDYMPHDTEIDEVAVTRACTRCGHSLET